MQAIVQTFAGNHKRAPLDSRTALFAMVVISAVMIGGKLSGVEFILRLICCTIPFLMLIAIQKYKMAFVYFLLYAYAMIMEGAVVRITNGTAELILIITAGIISRFLAEGMMGYCFMQSTTVSEFVTSMERMRVPEIITIPLSVMFRFFPTIQEENAAIRDAMRMREISGNRQGILKKIEYELVPVMMSTVRIGDELSQAALTKGLGGEAKRTHICEVGFRLRDYLLLGVMAAVLVLFVIF